MGVAQNGWLIMENPIIWMMTGGTPMTQETSKHIPSGYLREMAKKMDWFLGIKRGENRACDDFSGSFWDIFNNLTAALKPQGCWMGCWMDCWDLSHFHHKIGSATRKFPTVNSTAPVVHQVGHFPKWNKPSGWISRWPQCDVTCGMLGIGFFILPSDHCPVMGCWCGWW